MAARSLRQLWARDQAALGYMCQLGSPYAAELVADVGYDFLVIDQQHGLIGYETMVAMLQAVARIDVCTLVRVASHDRAVIGAALDAGAAGVIVPVVDSAEEAAAVVASCRFPPAGRRSFGPSRASTLTGGTPAEVGEEVVCIAMVETAAGLAAIDAIAGCPGIDGIIPGWADLALSLGLAPDRRHPQIDAALSRIVDSCLKHNIVAATGAPAGEARALTDRGYRMISVGSDVQDLRRSAAAALAASRGEMP
jgi:4-hydroxy-2-oxoheptanedioate aldolase